MACYFNDKKVLPLADFSQTDSFDSRRTANGEKILSPSFALVEKIKGKTVKSTNLIPFPYADGGAGTSVAKNGITYTVNGDGSLTLNGQNNGNGNSVLFLSSNLVLSAGTYIANLNTEISGISMVGYDGTNYINPIKGVTFSNETKLETLYVQVQKGNTTVFNNVKIYPMLNEGSTAQPYTPYFAGLKNAFINSIKSTGRNLFNEKYFEQLSVISADTYKGENCYRLDPTKLIDVYVPCLIEAGQRVFFSIDVAAPNGADLYIKVVFADGTKLNLWGISGGKVLSEFTTYTNPNLGYVYNADIIAIEITTYSYDKYKPYYFKNIMLSVGENRIDYEPYKESLFELPETLELGEWDYLNPIENTITRGTNTIVFDGTEAFVDDTYLFGRILFVLPVGYEANNVYPSPIISNYWRNYHITTNQGNNVIAFVLDNETESLDTFIQSLKDRATEGNPLMVAYELLEPTTETVEDLPRGYTAHKDGTETYLAGETDNSEWGAIPEFTLNYSKIMKEGTFNG